MTYHILIIAEHPTYISEWFRRTHSSINFQLFSISPTELAGQNVFEMPVDLVFWDENYAVAQDFLLVKQQFPQKPIFVVANNESEENIIQKFEMGCKGYIDKGSTAAAFAYAFNFFQDKGLFLSPTVWAKAKPYLKKGKLIKRYKSPKKPNTSFYSHLLFDLNTFYI